VCGLQFCNLNQKQKKYNFFFVKVADPKLVFLLTVSWIFFSRLRHLLKLLLMNVVLIQIIHP